MILSVIELLLRAEFGPGLRIDHFGGIVIHPNVKAGKNITLFHGVTMGENYGQRGVPILGDNVTILSRVVLAGSIRIGDDVIIGANSVVTKDIPEGCMVSGIPAKIIRRTS